MILSSNFIFGPPPAAAAQPGVSPDLHLHQPTLLPARFQSPVTACWASPLLSSPLPTPSRGRASRRQPRPPAAAHGPRGPPRRRRDRTRRRHAGRGQALPPLAALSRGYSGRPGIRRATPPPPGDNGDVPLYLPAPALPESPWPPTWRRKAPLLTVALFSGDPAPAGGKPRPRMRPQQRLSPASLSGQASPSTRRP